MARVIETASADITKGEVDPITLDLVENGLRNARHEMDEVLFRTALSPGIREQHDEFPLIADPDGKMVVGQFGLSIPDFLENFDGTISEGDVLMTSDPYACGAAISHANDWLLVMPVFHEGRVVGWASMFGHMSDVGGQTPCSMPTDARTIYEEGVVVPPFKLYRGGELNEDALEIILNQVRMPEWNRADLNGLVAACRTAGRRVAEMCGRFGTATYLSALDALLQRNYDAMKVLLQDVFEDGKTISFTDHICDDGVGNGPYELKVSLTRSGEKVHLDFTGSAPQAPGPINYFLNENLARMFFGIYMITVADPQILWNDGFYPLVDVTIPEDSYWKPRHPRIAERPQPRHRAGVRPLRRPARADEPRPAQRRGLLLQPALHVLRPLHIRHVEGRVVPALLDRIRRRPGPSTRRRARRALVVAQLRQHPLRVPGGVLPAARRRMRDGRQHRWGRTAPRRQRRGRDLRLRGARHDRDPRRPLADLPVGSQRRRTRCARDQVDRPGRRRPRSAAEQVPRRSRSAR